MTDVLDSFPDADFERLLTRLCDGTLTDAERSNLNERLAADSGARREYLAYIDLHASLLGGLPSVLPSPAPQSQHAASKMTWRAWSGALVAAAVLLAVAAALRFSSFVGEAPETHVASLGQLTVLDGEGAWLSPSGSVGAAVAGDPLRVGYSLQTSDVGLAVLTLTDGTQLELSPAARLRLPSGNRRDGFRFVLEAGLLQADVKPRPADDPLLVITAQAEVVVLGTQFCVSAAEPAATAIETVSGLVRVRRVTDGRNVEVPAGHFTVASQGSPALQVQRATELPLKPRATCDLYQARGLAFTADGAGLTAVSTRLWTCFDTITARARYEPQVTAQKSEIYVVSSSGLQIVTHGRTAPIALYDAATGQTLQRTRYWTKARTVWAVDRDARVALYGSTEHEPGNRLTLWDPYAARARAELPLDAAATALAVSEDGALAAVGIARESTVDGVATTEHWLQLWNLQTQQVAATLAAPEQLQLLSFSRDGSRLAGVTRHGGALVWEIPSGRIVARRDGSNGWTHPIYAQAFSADGRRLALGLANGRVRLWDLQDDRELGLIHVGKHAVSALAISPDGRTLASCVLRGSVNLWDLP